MNQLKIKFKLYEPNMLLLKSNDQIENKFKPQRPEVSALRTQRPNRDELQILVTESVFYIIFIYKHYSSVATHVLFAPH